MDILVVGSGGREHALARSFAKSPHVAHVFCAPGNPGMCAEKISCVQISQDDFKGLADFCVQHNIDWTFVGPELPLFSGIVDYFEARGLKIFGPTQKAAQIESSKSFAKDLMEAHHIPTAKYSVHTSYESALDAVKKQCVTSSHFTPIVIKADGPAAGKGVIIARTLHDADQALQEIFTLHEFGSQTKVVLEEFLEGPEFSFFTLVYGNSRIYLPCAQDFKRQGTGDTGLNTGGMGAYTPVPFVTPELVQQTITTIVEPTLSALQEQNAQFNGVLYTGLMLTSSGPYVIEFNARFGDPETQVITSVLDEDAASMIDELLSGTDTKRFAKAHGSCVGVVVAADGYPKSYIKNIPLTSFSNPPSSIELIYAGVKSDTALDTQTDVTPCEKLELESRAKLDVNQGDLLSSGGRILMALSEGSSIAQARKHVYDYLDSLELPHMFYRSDIALKAQNNNA